MHSRSASAASSDGAAMQADLALILGTRYDWTIGYGRPPRFSPDLKVIQVDVEPEEIGRNRRADVGFPGADPSAKCSGT